MEKLATSLDEGLSEQWCAEHFDPLAPELGPHLDDVMARMRQHCPVTHSDQHGGFWVVSRYEDVLRVSQDWSTFTVEESLTVPPTKPAVTLLPEEVDPPLHRQYRKVVNPFFTPEAASKWRGPTRQIATRLIDRFIDSGRCDFMSDFAAPYPGMALFDQVLHAPPDQIEWLSEMATIITKPSNPQCEEAWKAMFGWIDDLIESRSNGHERGDVVDGIINAEIDGRPITREEVIGLLQLVITGGLETTTGALGMAMLRFCRQPDIFALLRSQPSLIPEAIEELLRLDTPFPHLCRTAKRDVVMGDRVISQGEKVLMSWASANRDATEFPSPETFDPHRPTKRHLTFGAGPHRCLGSNLARMNLRIAVEELVRRFECFRLLDEDAVTFHLAYNRTPLSVAITFTPSPS